MAQDERMATLRDFTDENASSPLLRLPQEIKDEIYRWALGGQVLHVHRSPTAAGSLDLPSYRCQSGLSDIQAQDLFDSSSDMWNVDALAIRHDDCCDRGYLTKPRFHLLQVCRQVYREARVFIYSSNTFCFNSHHVYTSLRMAGLHTKPFSRPSSWPFLALCSIQLGLEIEDLQDEEQWGFWLAWLTKWAPNLQRMDIGIDQRYRPHFLRERSYVVPTQDKSPLLAGLMRLRKLPLKVATVTICDDADFLFDVLYSTYNNGQTLESYRWTLAQKQEWAGYVRKHILRRMPERQLSQDPVGPSDMGRDEKRSPADMLGEVGIANARDGRMV